MKTLTREQVEVLIAFLDAFDLQVTGAWARIEECMRDNFGIEDPEAALERVREALSR